MATAGLDETELDAMIIGPAVERAPAQFRAVIDDQHRLAAIGHQAPSRPSRGIVLRLVRRSRSTVRSSR